MVVWCLFHCSFLWVLAGHQCCAVILFWLVVCYRCKACMLCCFFLFDVNLVLESCSWRFYLYHQCNSGWTWLAGDWDAGESLPFMCIDCLLSELCTQCLLFFLALYSELLVCMRVQWHTFSAIAVSGAHVAALLELFVLAWLFCSPVPCCSRLPQLMHALDLNCSNCMCAPIILIACFHVLRSTPSTPTHAHTLRRYLECRRTVIAIWPYRWDIRKKKHLFLQVALVKLASTYNVIKLMCTRLKVACGLHQLYEFSSFSLVLVGEA